MLRWWKLYKPLQTCVLNFLEVCKNAGCKKRRTLQRRAADTHARLRNHEWRYDWHHVTVVLGHCTPVEVVPLAMWRIFLVLLGCKTTKILIDFVALISSHILTPIRGPTAPGRWGGSEVTKLRGQECRPCRKHARSEKNAPKCLTNLD